MGEVQHINGAQVAAPGRPDADLVAFVQELLARVEAGQVTAVGTVEVEQGGKVCVGFCHKSYYHQLNSGAARLAARLATLTDGA